MNRPIIITKKNDLFNIFYKVEALESILRTTRASIIALFGKWGSGKSSIIKTLEDRLESKSENTDKFKIIYFEAWRLENDNNLQLSLFEMIIDNIQKNTKENDYLRKLAWITLNYSKEIIITSKFGPFAKAVFNTYEKYIDVYYKKDSFWSKQKEFKEKFEEIINDYCVKREEKIIVFIDDLDRCEPDRALNLLSSIKHLFPAGDKILYFAALDKAAIEEAINAKYNNKINSTDYLEKIFDISFNMPNICSLEKYTNNFSNNFIENFFGDDNFSETKVREFFETIKFNNPRKLKKIEQKYFQVISLIIEGANSDEKSLLDDNWSKIVLLYFIIIYEFNNQIFMELYNCDKKINKWRSAHRATEISFNFTSNHSAKLINQFNNLSYKKNSIGLNFENKILKQNIYGNEVMNYNPFLNMIYFLLPLTLNSSLNWPMSIYGSINSEILSEKTKKKCIADITTFKDVDNEIACDFIIFILNNSNGIGEKLSDIAFIKYMNICLKYL